jgi:hypothetical protein
MHAQHSMAVRNTPETPIQCGQRAAGAAFARTLGVWMEGDGGSGRRVTGGSPRHGSLSNLLIPNTSRLPH